MTECLDAALRYAKAGWKVFPCLPGSKHPATKKGFHNATTDESKIVEWWTRRPELNLAISIPPGHFVLDIDDGAELMGLELPVTVEARTPNKGRHLWFKTTGTEIPPRVGILPNVDVRGVGSYVVVPPSQIGGKKYIWQDDGLLDPANEVIVVPPWLESLVRLPDLKKEERSAVNIPEMLRGLPEGQRQIGLFRAACSMRARHFHEDEALILIDAIAKASDWNEGDPAEIVRRAYKRYEPGESHDEKKIWTLDELIAANLGEPDWFADNLLARGLCLVWAEPKAGKSLLVQNLCLALATGQKAWGMFPVKRSRGVLYLDLEQDEVSARKRWELALNDYPPPENLRLAFKWNKADRGGMDDLRSFLNANPDVEVVVIDVLSNFWPAGQDTTRNAYYSEYDILQEMKDKIANEYGVCLILVHHNNKSGEVSGSNAMKGAPHYLFDLMQPDESNVGIVRTKGKNVPQREILMMFDYENARCRAMKAR